MNNPNPFVPKGSLLDHQSQRRSRMKIAVGCVLAVSICGLLGLLIQGCKREAPADQNSNVTPPPLVDTNTPVQDTNPPVADTNPPVPTPVQPQAMTQPQVPVVPVVPPPAQPQVTVPMEPGAGATYEVVAGDTLDKIAKAHGVTVKALEAANPGVNPKKLKVKQKLVIPGATQTADNTATSPTANAGGTSGGGETYVVKSGDTLTKIAKKHGISVKALKAANSLNTDHIKVGDKLTLPVKAETATSAPAPVETAPAPVVPPTTAATSSPAPITPAPGH